MKRWSCLALFFAVSVWADNRPNILWIYLEDINPEFFSCYGAGNPTPQFMFR